MRDEQLPPVAGLGPDSVFVDLELDAYAQKPSLRERLRWPVTAVAAAALSATAAAVLYLGGDFAWGACAAVAACTTGVIAMWLHFPR